MRYGEFLKVWSISALFFTMVDAVWLGFLAKNFYKQQLGPLMRERPIWSAVISFYTLYTLAIVILAALPASRNSSWETALLNGAVLGLAAYGTYDLSNIATLKSWPLAVTFVDMAWGTLLTTCTAYFAFYLLQT